MAHFDLATLLVVLLPLAFVIYWVTDLIKDITNGNWSAVLTKVTAFVGAFLVLNLYAHSQIDLGGDKTTAAREFLARLAWSDLMLLGLVIAAGGGSFADYLRARNSADPTVKDTLLPPKKAPNPPPTPTINP